MTTTGTTDATVTTELFEAARSGDLATVDRLLAADPDLASERDGDGLSLVINACYRGRSEVVKRILAAAPTLDVFDAATVGDVARMAQLLHADPGLVDAWSVDGYQPLMLAAFFGRIDVARALLDQCASVDNASRNAMAVMPLHSAAAGGHTALARLLVDFGADVDASSHGGFVPLHAAAQNGDLELVRILLDSGAEPAPRTDKGQTPAELAAEAGHSDIVALLVGAVADQ